MKTNDLSVYIGAIPLHFAPQYNKQNNFQMKLEFHTTSPKQMGGVFSIYMGNTSIGTCAKFCFVTQKLAYVSTFI